MHFHNKMPENGKQNIFSDKQTTNMVSLMFFDVKILTKNYQISFFDSVKKQATYSLYSALKNLKITSKKCQEWSER